jgi:hypothetical protein
MDALGFEYPHYERLEEEVGGLKRKKGCKCVEEDKKKRLTKNPKLAPEPWTPKKRKAMSSDRGEEERPSPPKHLEETPSQLPLA